MSANPAVVQCLYERLNELSKTDRALRANHYFSIGDARKELRPHAYRALLHDPETRSWTSADECMAAATRWAATEAECFKFAEDFTGERHPFALCGDDGDVPQRQQS